MQRSFRSLVGSIAAALLCAAVAGFVALATVGQHNKGDWTAYFHRRQDLASRLASYLPTPNQPTPTPTPNQPTPTQAELTAWAAKLRVVDAPDNFFLFFSLQTSFGTAFYINPTTLLTAGHVVSVTPGNAFRITHGSEVNYPAHLVDKDAELDIALLSPSLALTPNGGIVFGLRDQRPNAGENVWGLCAEEPTIVPMTVNSPHAQLVERQANGAVTYGTADAILLSGEAHPGCSGGPLVDAHGDVVGVMVTSGSGETGAIASVDINNWLRSLGY